MNPFQTGSYRDLMLLFHPAKLRMTALPTAYMLKKRLVLCDFAEGSGDGSHIPLVLMRLVDGKPGLLSVFFTC